MANEQFEEWFNKMYRNSLVNSKVQVGDNFYYIKDLIKDAFEAGNESKNKKAEVTFTLQGETPSKKNSRIMNTKTKRSFPNPRYVEWHDLAIAQMRSQIHDYKAPEKCFVSVKFIHGDKRRRDSDNGVSSIMDMLKDAGVIIDDCWEYVPHEESLNEYEKGNAHCDITIYKEF